MPLMILIAIALGTAVFTASGTPPTIFIGLAAIATLVGLYWLLGNLFYPVFVTLGWVK